MLLKEHVFGVDQLFIWHLPNNSIGLLVDKVIDDFFSAGFEEEINSVLHYLKGVFTLGASWIGHRLTSPRCTFLIQNDGTTWANLQSYFDWFHPLQISQDRKFSNQLPAEERNWSEYWILAGILIYLGQAGVPYACMVACKVQQKLGFLTVGHSLDANSMLGEPQKLDP